MRELETVVIAHPGSELYGSDRVMLETLAGLVDAGRRVVLVVPCDGPIVRAAQVLGAETLVSRTPVLRKAMLKPWNLPLLAVSSLAGAARIARLVRRIRPSAVYVSTLTIPLWSIVPNMMRVPVLAHVHESERGAHHLLREAIALPLLAADRVIVNSAHSRDALTEVLPRLRSRSAVVYNGVAGPQFLHQPRERLDGGLRVLYVGRLSPRKGVDVAIEAVAMLAQSGVDVRLDVVGGVFPGYEWYQRRLHQQAQDLGISDRVRFHGFQASVWGALADADVAVVPSRLDEPFGNTAVEALLAARPVVVSAIGGLAEAIDGFASAQSVDPDDSMRLAGALHRVADNWESMRRAALADAPLAAVRYAPTGFRDRMVTEIDALLPGARRERQLVTR